MFAVVEAPIEDLKVGDTVVAITGDTAKITTWEKHDDEADPITGEPIPVHYHVIVRSVSTGEEFDGVMTHGAGMAVVVGVADDEANLDEEIKEAARNFVLQHDDPVTAMLKRLGII